MYTATLYMYIYVCTKDSIYIVYVYMIPIFIYYKHVKSAFTQKETPNRSTGL